MNPIFPFFLLKSYFTDVDRIRKDEEEIEKYREKQFKKILKIALSTRLYREKYKGIDVEKITLSRIEKLPILTKNDLRKHFPDGIIPDGFKKKNAHVVSTSGSTGQPTSVYTDFYTIIKALMGFVREIKEYGINWRKDRMTIIADLTPKAIEEAYLVKGMPFKFRNIQTLHIGEDVEKLMEKINEFKPKFLGGYPGVLRALAVLKNKGKGKNIEPEIIASSGAVLDEYTKRYIEDAFNARIYDVYGSTEAGPIAFECVKGSYHIHHDFVHLEFLNENLEPVKYGKAGQIVVTKLYGKTTPIIRYNGLNDFVIPLARKCGCGINTPLIEKIAGRKADSIVTPDGKIIPPLSITGIPGKVMERLNVFAVKQFQIVQENFDELKVYLVIENGKKIKEKIIEEVRKEFQKRIKGMKINIIEKDEIKKEGLLTPVVKSKVKLE